jgi:hypothetical protein
MPGNWGLSAGLSSVQAAAGPSGGAADTLTSGLGTDELAELLARAEAANKKGAIVGLTYSQLLDKTYVCFLNLIPCSCDSCKCKQTVLRMPHSSRDLHDINELAGACRLQTRVCKLTAPLACMTRAHLEHRAAGVGMQRWTRPAACMTWMASLMRTPKTWSGRRPSCSNRQSAGTPCARLPQGLRTVTQAAPCLAGWRGGVTLGAEQAQMLMPSTLANWAGCCSGTGLAHLARLKRVMHAW